VISPGSWKPSQAMRSRLISMEMPVREGEAGLGSFIADPNSVSEEAVSTRD
jgi:hypothetical protein